MSFDLYIPIMISFLIFLFLNLEAKSIGFKNRVLIFIGVKKGIVTRFSGIELFHTETQNCRATNLSIS